MGEKITISLPGKLGRELDELASREGGSRSDIVRRAIADYVFLRQYDAACARLTAEARAKGIYTEEDVRERIGDGR